MALSQQQFDKLQKQLISQKAAQLPTPTTPQAQQATSNKPLLERAGEFVSRNNLPGSKIGENIGTSFAALKANAEGNYEGAQAISQSAPSTKELIGDVARSAAIPTSLMAPNPASVAGAVGQFGALGAVSGAGEAAANNQDSQGIARGALSGFGIGAAAGVFSKLLEKGISKIGSLTGKTGEKITQTIIKPNKTDLEDGFSVNTIKKYNLGGSLKTMQSKTDALMDDLTKQLNAKYAGTTAKIDLNDILNKTINESAGSKVNTFGSNTSMENAFNQLKGEIATISADGNVSIPEAVQIKRAAGHFGAWVYGQTDPESTARQKVYTSFYRQMKTAIEQNSEPGVKEVNKQLSELIPVMNAIIRRIPVAERNATLSLTDVISLSASTIDPRSLSVFALNQLSKSGVVAKGLMEAGPAIEKGAGALAPAIRAGSTALPQALESTINPTTQSPQSQSSQKPITEEEARKIMDITMNTVPGGIGLGVAKGGMRAADIMKEALLGKLRQTAPKLSNALDTKLADEGDDFIKFLEETPNPTIAQMNRGLEILKRQGHDVSEISERIIKATRQEYDQARDTLGRWIK